jgi:hypothetical protein
MQKVVGSNPISRSQKRPAFAGLFCVRGRLVCLRRVGLTPDSPRADRRPFQGKPPVCRSILVRPNRSPSAGLQKVGCSACCGRYPDSSCNGTILRTAPAGAIPAVASVGPVRFQSGNREVNLSPLRDPGEPWPQSRELSPQDGLRGSGAVPITGGLCRGSHTGHRRRCRFHREAGVCAHLGWAAGCRPSQASGADARDARIQAKAAASHPLAMSRITYIG